MHVVMISPGYPPEMRQFTRGLAEVGAQVIGLGDQPEQALDEDLRRHLAAYIQIRNQCRDEAEMVETARGIAALQFQDGFTHMEWYRKADGEAVFGEIGARPPGANMVEVMNYACDMDLFRGWAGAVCHGRLSQEVTRKYNCAIVFKRAEGQGRIRHIEGLDGFLQRFGAHVARIDLLPIGAPRRDWKQIQISDGHLILRHPELQETLRMADAVGTDVRLDTE